MDNVNIENFTCVCITLGSHLEISYLLKYHGNEMHCMMLIPRFKSKEQYFLFTMKGVFTGQVASTTGRTLGGNLQVIFRTGREAATSRTEKLKAKNSAPCDSKSLWNLRTRGCAT